MNDYTKKALNGVELSYTDDGKVEVLVSPGYGAGWSTWNGGIKIAVDKRIVDFFKRAGQDADKNLVEAFLRESGYKHVYCGGWDDIVIETVEPGVPFKITEYDGFEELEEVSPQSYYQF